MSADQKADRPSVQSSSTTLNVRWDDSNMQSHYANVVNTAGTREEIILMFGVHQAWQSGVKDVTVQLSDRIILSPYAAKRLHVLLGQTLREYETRYGVLKLEGTTSLTKPVEPAATK